MYIYHLRELDALFTLLRSISIPSWFPHSQEVATRRLATFYETTSPLLEYYSSQSIAPLSSMASQLAASPTSSTKPPGHAAGADALVLTSIAGRTSDEIWPRLESLIVEYFGVKERRGNGGSGGGAAKKSNKLERDIDVSTVEVIDKAAAKDVRNRIKASL